MKPLAIIGLDPGTTTAYAILDLNGNLLKIFSSKELPLSETISQIITICHPIITSTDKAKLPSFIEEFSRKLGTLVFTPEEDLKKEEKRLIIQGNISISKINEIIENKINHNEHEMDSLSSAFFAYKKYLPKLHKIKQFFIENKNCFSEEQEQEFIKIALKEELNFHLVKALILGKNPENIILKEIISSPLKENNTKNDFTAKSFLRLYEQLKNLRAEKKLLSQRLEESTQKLHQAKKNNLLLDKQKQHFDRKVEGLFHFKEERLKLLEKELHQQSEVIALLQKKAHSIYEFMALASSSDNFLLKKLENFSWKEFAQKKDFLKIGTEDFLLVQNPQIISEKVLSELKEKAPIILTFTPPGRLVKENFSYALISPEELSQENEHFALMETEKLLAKINRKDLIVQIITEYKEKRSRDESKEESKTENKN